MGDERSELGELPLFSGAHVAANRFVRALDKLDLRAAIADAPEPWRDAVAGLAEALRAHGPARASVERIAACRRAGWPVSLERAWQRLVGLCLDAHGIPGVLAGEPAAAYLLRGGEIDRARSSIGRHLGRHPRDAAAWQLMARFDPIRGAVRCALHGGAILDGVEHLLDSISEDDVAPPKPWLLPYAWFARDLELEDVSQALEALGTTGRPPLLVPGDPHAFAWYLLDAGGRRYGRDSVGVVEARARLQRISATAFTRYLARVSARAIIS